MGAFFWVHIIPAKLMPQSMTKAIMTTAKKFLLMMAATIIIETVMLMMGKVNKIGDDDNDDIDYSYHDENTCFH